MGAFILFLSKYLLIYAVVLVAFGLALAGNFQKWGIPKWKAFVPFYNIFTWVRFNKIPWWVAFLILHFPLLPVWWILTTSMALLVFVTLNSLNLYKKTSRILMYTVLAFVVMGLLNYFFTGRAELFAINGIVALGCFSLLFAAGLSNQKFDSERYYSKEFKFKDYAGRQFKKNKLAYYSSWIVGILTFIAIYAPYLATEHPWYVEYRGQTYFPAYTNIFNPTKNATTINPLTKNPEKLQFDIAEWKKMKLDKVVWAPVAYEPNKSDRYNRGFVAPGETNWYKNPDGERVIAPTKFRHHLGTDDRGQDVLSALIHGTRISLTLGFGVMGIAALLGILIGALSGYFGDHGLKTSRIRYWLILLGIFLLIFYGFITHRWPLALLALIVCVLISVFFGKLFEFGPLKKQIAVPMDSIALRSFEVLRSLPRLVLIITISAVAEKRELWLLMVIIGATSWVGIARFTRAEFLRTRSLQYIEAAKTMGFSNFRTIFKHALPNSLAPVYVAIAFGIASAILTESGLSFLGIGVPDDINTWGQMLSKGRQEFEAWWMVIFPGLAIFLVVTIYNLIGDGIRDATDPKLKQ